MIQRAAYSIETKRADPSTRFVSSLTQRAASGNQRTQIDKAMQGMFRAVEKAKDAREDSGRGTLGAIFMGPLVGTAIGKAIGNAASDSNQDAASEAKKQGGVTSLASLLEQSATYVARSERGKPWRTT